MQYKYGLKPVTTAPALETGLTYHDKIDQLIKTGKFEQDHDLKTNAMALAFKKYILPKLSKNIETEKWFELKTFRDNVLVGRYDGLCDDFIVEHKSTSDRIDGAYWAALELDEQILSYMVASGKHKVFYTACQKPTLRQSKFETAEEFQERCVNWYNTDTETKIAYQIITRTPDEVWTFENEIDSMCDEIEHCKNFYRNPNYCTRYRMLCDFMPICKHYDPNQHYIGFEKREEG